MEKLCRPPLRPSAHLGCNANSTIIGWAEKNTTHNIVPSLAVDVSDLALNDGLVLPRSPGFFGAAMDLNVVVGTVLLGILDRGRVSANSHVGQTE